MRQICKTRAYDIMESLCETSAHICILSMSLSIVKHKCFMMLIDKKTYAYYLDCNHDMCMDGSLFRIQRQYIDCNVFGLFEIMMYTRMTDLRLVIIPEICT